jgi:heat-inducible transcriptional repressor
MGKKRMSNLTERQKLILGLVVQDYVNSAKPVGSNTLVEKYDLDLSSATIRNEMMALSEAGFLRQPHTSAGRIPTEDGYRFFVRQLMQRPALPESLKHTITHQFYQARHDSKEWAHLAASILAHQSNAASIVTAPITEDTRYKLLQLIPTTGRQVLMVLVTMNGNVCQQMLVLSEPVQQEKLTAAAEKLNSLLLNKDVADLDSLALDLDALGQDIYKLVHEEMTRSSQSITGEIFQEGWTNVLSEPEFANSETALRALKILEEPIMLEELLSQTVKNSEIGGVQVLIGGEGNWEELSDCSLVLGRYGVQDLASGYLGVLGPIRMPYGHTISTVNFVSRLMSNIVSENLGKNYTEG